VHTRQVEDWTGKASNSLAQAYRYPNTEHVLFRQGLDDLASHRIRTPLPPLQTFYDDPLRILRSLRFASRFGYSLDPELTECLGDRVLLVNFESLRSIKQSLNLLPYRNR
jgi:tRNA nucleotidyltransferase/poly(A) polymerase